MPQTVFSSNFAKNKYFRPAGAFSKSRPIWRSRIPVCPEDGRTDLWDRAGKLTGECATRNGSRIRGASEFGPGRLVSVEKLRGTDLCLGRIDATPRLQTRVLTWDHGC